MIKPDAALAQRFHEVDGLLRKHRLLWASAPFKLLTLPWEADYPALVEALTRLPAEALFELETHPARARRYLARWLPRLADRVARAEPGALDAPLALDDSLKEGVPARKWQQIEAFLGNLPTRELPVLEWCSGKGHLARITSQLTGQRARCVERDEQLAHAGRRIAEERELPVDFAILDALGEPAAAEVRPDQLACALHACGELHVRLIELAVDRQTRALAISPCCYHLFPGDQVRALSRPGQASTLALSRDQCRLALQEAVTATPAVRRRQRQLAAWRLGFDLLQRELRGVDEYLPVPSVPDRRALDFASFVRWAAERKQIELPASIDHDRLEAAGHERLDRVRRLNLVRHMFRRPIELWLVLDRALYLQESDYDVEVGTFCDRRVTPRNLLIRAVRRGA